MRWSILSLLLCLVAPPLQAAPLGGAPVRLDEVLRVVGAESEARDRLDPTALLLGALDAATEAVPALTYERAAGPSLRLRVGTRQRELSLASLTSLPALAVLLADAADFLAAALPPGEPLPHLAATFTDGLLRALDAHSALLSVAAFGDFQSKASGRIGGLGMLLAQSERHLAVDAVLPGSPAARAGVRPGDRILQIDELSALHLPVDEALGLIRGRVGTLVNLLILRPHEPAPRQLALRRSDLHFASVESRVFPEGARERVGYLRVRSFQETTTAELRDHLQRLGAGSAGLLGLVLDLRDNPGGVLEQAIRVADLFLERGTIVTLRGPRTQPEAVPARWYRGVTSAPLVVLVNGGTASAAEIVAGALKFNHRALLLGTPTFGKNSIQSVFPLSGGNALKLTVARFFPVGERSIEGSGVIPHVWLRPVQVAPRPGRQSGLLGTAIGVPLPPAGRPADAPKPLRELPYLVAGEGGAGGLQGGQTRLEQTDYPLALALRLLRLNTPQGQSALLGTALERARIERRTQDHRIAERLAAAGVDWSAGTGGPGGQVELVRVTLDVQRTPNGPWEPLAEGAGVPGGARLRLGFSLRNAGALPLHRVLGVSRSAAPHLDGLELPVGLLPAGGTARGSLEVSVPADVPEGVEPLRLRIYDGHRQLHYLATLFIPQAAPGGARLRLVVAAFDDGTGGSRGNGDGRAQPGEVLALRVRMINEGRGATGTGRYWLSGSGLAQARVIHSWQPFGSLAPGASAEDTLLLALGEAPGAAAPALTLSLMSDLLATPELSWSFRLGHAQPLPRLTLQAPLLSLRPPPAVVGGPQVLLEGRVRAAAGLREVQIFRNGHKVHVAAPEPGAADALALRVTVPLEPGRNRLRVVARDRDGLVSERDYVLWQGRGQGFPIGLAPRGGA